MIRYRLPESLAPQQAATLEHPALRRLRGRGPWSCAQVPGGVALTHHLAASVQAWGPELAGMGGLSYTLPDPMPAFVPAAWIRKGSVGDLVRLRCGHEIPVAPAAADGISIGLDGQLGGPVSEYGRLAVSLWDRVAALGAGDSIPFSDPDLIALARLACMSCTTLTEELVHAFGLISTGDLGTLFDAAVGIPKAEAGAHGSPAALPASTPPA